VTKLLCFGDLHLGAGSDYGAEPGDRLRDQQDVLAMIVQLANENEVDAVLFAGDAFHRRRPTPAEMLACADPLASSRRRSSRSPATTMSRPRTRRSRSTCSRTPRGCRSGPR
jgi:hypothetical protein